MRMRDGWPALGLATALLWGQAAGAADTAGAAPVVDGLEQRVQRLERVVNSGTLMEMLDRLESLQQEVQTLRGRVEELEHSVEGLRERQRDLYVDVDRRLSRLEREGAAAPTASRGQAAGDRAGTGAATGGDGQPPAADGGGGTGGDAATAGAKPQQASPEERKAYESAFDLLRELRYARAIEAFQAFLKEYPDGRYAHLAQYWLAEAHYAQGEYEQAITHYWRLINQYPDSAKMAEAMLKIGYSRHQLGKDGEAKQILEELVRRFPDSTEAGQAENLLRQLGGG